MAHVFSWATALHNATTRVSKSTALRPMGWLIGLCLSGAIFGPGLHVPGWIEAMLGVATMLSVIVYIAAYCFFAHSNPDALRSETYLIQQQMIAKGAGDSIVGLPTSAAVLEPRSLTAAVLQQGGSDTGGRG
jgi:hypothetical protein